MASKRIRLWVKAYLKDGPKSKDQIFGHVNDKCRHGTSASALSNILARSPDFVREGDNWTLAVVE